MLDNAAVQEKLNELLDANGGISKRKVSKFCIVLFECLNLISFCLARGMLLECCWCRFNSLSKKAEETVVVSAV